MLELKSNLAGKFLKLSVSKEGNRAFVIFPAGWNEKGWVRIFDSIAAIMGQPSFDPVLLRKGNSAQAFLPRRAPTGAPLPPPPLGCCPQCGFTGEPACFLRSFAGALSSSPSTKVLGSSIQEFSVGEPISAIEAQGNAEFPALSLLNGKKSGYAQSHQQNQVYVRRRVQGPSTTANVEGSASIVRAAGEVDYGTPDASFALLAPSSSFPPLAEVNSLDPTRLEADIVSELYLVHLLLLWGLIVFLHW